MVSFVKKVGSVIRKADIILFVLDARTPLETRNVRVEHIIAEKDKGLIYVINKSDLVDKNSLRGISKQLSPCVFISASEKKGIGLLRERILIEASKRGIKGRNVIVGVLGYPNVGKSSLINVLSSRKVAPTSNVAGTTKDPRTVRSRSGIILIDSPGVIPSIGRDEVKLAFIGTIDFSRVKDPEAVFFALLDSHPGVIERFYGVAVSSDKDETLEQIALKKGILIKGGKPDSGRMARKILQRWQKGEIR